MYFLQDALRNGLVATEVLMWFYIGECIGKGGIVGYDVWIMDCCTFSLVDHYMLKSQPECCELINWHLFFKNKFLDLMFNLLKYFCTFIVAWFWHKGMYKRACIWKLAVCKTAIHVLKHQEGKQKSFILLWA